MGKVLIYLQYSGRSSNAYICFLKGLQRPLLGRPELDSLNVLIVVASVDVDKGGHTVTIDMKTMSPKSEQCCIERNKWLLKYPRLLQGLGKLKCSYKITLNPSISPFSCSVPRRVSLPLLPKVERALKEMVSDGIISKVEGL